ncbi:S8 family peptidase [Kangiella geojedonensis]|uniref:Peptidase S8 and S53 subtilisin kexin sedolisin n=1 Tax=Kangiella geojedonensis TaxID=914150 RepID=A0A0F6TPU6_9GAMM|nr:S8 family peptidase [Kangiella geojedonensis]AKE51325.1 Peptidase S8 and S53 subtilisin kexin sedolisin [Kangiella geojedonensis]
MKLNKVVAGVVLATGTVGAYAGQFKTAPISSNAVANQYIVVLKDDAVAESEGIFSSQANAKAVQMLTDNLSLRYKARVTRNFKSVLKGGVFTMSKSQAQLLAKDPRVKLVEQDQRVSIAATQSNPTWGLDRIDQRELPLDNNYIYSTDASNVNAYIIDSGVTDHSDFGGRLNGGYDFVDNDNDPRDCNGHGTHVAGTVGSETYGVAKNVNLIGIRVLDCRGEGSWSGIISGMDWVAENHTKPAVANMSLGGGFMSSINEATQALTDAGVIVVAAGGNDGKDACDYSPASTPSAITVGSTDDNDARSIFNSSASSNYGSCLDIFAPGSDILSTRNNGGTQTMSGTSMAAPHVAGIAALYLADNPNASVNEVTQAILDAATPNLISDAKSGSPNLLAYSFFDGSNPDPDPDPDPEPEPGNELQDGVAVDLSGAQDSQKEFTFDVPADASSVDFQMSGGSGDADMYVKFGSAPTMNSYDCRPYRNGNNESCDFNAQEGTYYVMVHGYSSYSNASLVANHDGGDTKPDPDPNPGEGGEETVNNISGNSGQWNHYYVDIPAGMSSLSATLSGGTGNADLYIRRGSQPTRYNYDCVSFNWGNNESCSVQSPAVDRYYISVFGSWGSYSGATLHVVWE